MKKQIKKISIINKIINRGILNCFLYLLLLIKQYIFKNNSSMFRITFFKNRHLNKRAFIIGNGPSLSKVNLDLLRNEITFASNKIFLIYDKFKWRPTYYTVEDDLVFSQNKEKITNLKDSIKIYPAYGMSFIGYDPESVYVKHNHDMEKFQTDCQIDLQRKGLFWLGSVVHTQIQLAIYMGIKEIYLLGVDFHFSDTKNKINSQVYINSDEKNHFTKT